MAWLSRIDFGPSDYAHAQDLNNIGLDFRTWGGDVNGGNHVLSNVILQGSGGFQYMPSPVQVTPAADGTGVLQLDQTVGSGASASQVPRWTVGKDGSAETGSNAGSNFAINRYSDTGVLLGTPISINRATGLITMGPGGQQWAGPVNGGGQTLSNVVIPGVLQDPTANKGDIIARGAAALTAVGIGTPGQVLTVDTSQPANLKWATPVGNVTSVFGRTGAVVFTAAEVMGPSGASHQQGIVPDPGASAGATRYLREDATWAIPAGGSGGGMTDPTTTKGDLIVNNGSGTTRLGVGGDGQILVADHTVALGVKWGAAGSGGYWVAGTGGAIYYNGGNVGIGTAAPAYLLDARNTSGAGQLHLSGTGNDDGVYLVAYSVSGLALSSGVAFNGTNWIAKATTWAEIATVNDSIQFFTASGATIGSVVSPGSATMAITKSMVGIGTTAPQCPLDVNGIIRASGTTNSFTSGSGVTIYSNSGVGYIQSYDYTAAAMKPMYVQGNPVCLNPVAGTGNVGIGTTAPDCTLTVRGPSSGAGTGSQVKILNSAGSGFTLLSYAPGNTQFVMGAHYNGSAWVALDTGAVAFQQTANGLTVLAASGLTVGGSVSMIAAMTVLGSNGNVGIGTASPQTMLEVNGFARMTGAGSAPSTGASLELYYNGSGVVQAYDRTAAAYKPLYISGSPTALMSGNVGIGTTSPGGLLNLYQTTAGGYQFILQSGSPVAQWGLAISSATGDFLLNDMTVPATRFSVLKSNGYVGIGSAVPSYPLHVAGDCNITGTYRVNGTPISTGGGITSITWQAQGGGNFVTGAGSWIVNITGINNASVGGGLSGNTVTITISAVSDLRTKQNVETLTGGLSIIDQLRPVRAEWNGAIGKPKGQKMISVIAQEIQEILPEAVDVMSTKLYPEDDEPTEVLTLGELPIVAHLILAVQQLKARIEQLEQRRN